MVSILNMCSVGADTADDRTARARIRDAAIDCFARLGAAGTTTRRVAEAAGVSPGLVIHHFGSMEALRTACDEHVVAYIRDRKTEAIAQGPGLDVLAALRQYRGAPAMRYVARMLADDSEAADSLVDDLVADAAGYMRKGVESGMLRPSGDLEARAAVVMLWGLGALVLHRHVERLLGTDLLAPDALSGPAAAGYLAPAYSLLGEGMLTPEAAQSLTAAISQISERTTPPATGPAPNEDGP